MSKLTSSLTIDISETDITSSPHMILKMKVKLRILRQKQQLMTLDIHQTLRSCHDAEEGNPVTITA